MMSLTPIVSDRN